MQTDKHDATPCDVTATPGGKQRLVVFFSGRHFHVHRCMGVIAHQSKVFEGEIVYILDRRIDLQHLRASIIQELISYSKVQGKDEDIS